MANYLIQFCLQLGTMAASSSQLPGATKDWKWTSLHNVSLEEVTALIMSDLVLKPFTPDTSQRICLVCDSSDIGIAGWITQKQEDGLIRPARFHSRKFSYFQINYVVFKK